MKKQVILLLLILFSSITVKSQTVDSIKVEQTGNYIKIGYKILNSKPGQLFRVSVLCSINGGLNTEIRSVSGDIGDHIMGGKPEYWVVWDVLKDVKELQSAEFIVRAELLDSKSLKKIKPHKKNFNLMFAAQLPGTGIGLRFGYLGNFGFSLQYIRGKASLISGSNYPDKPYLNRLSFDFTKRIIRNEQSQVHLLMGISTGQLIIKEDLNGFVNYTIHYEPGVELGVAFTIHKTAFSITGSRLIYQVAEKGTTENRFNYLAMSFGIKF